MCQVDGLTLPNYESESFVRKRRVAPIDKNIFTQDVDGHASETAYRIKKNNKGVLVLQLYSTQSIAQPGGASLTHRARYRPTWR